MKIFRIFYSVIAATGLSALLLTPAARAAGGGGAAVGGTAGGASGGGGHGGGGASAGAAHGGGSSSGFHGGGFTSSSGSMHSSGQMSGGAPNFSAGSAGRVRPAAIVTASRPVTATQQDFSTNSHAAVPAARQPANAWTDEEIVGGSSRAANLSNRSDAAYRNYIANGNDQGLNTPEGYNGTILYPGAYGYALNRSQNALNPQGTGYGGYGARSYAQYRNWYGANAGYHRYWPNGYLPYFGGYYGYPYYGSYGDLSYDGSADTSATDSPDNVPTATATMNSGPSDAPVANNNGNSPQNDNAGPLPNAQARAAGDNAGNGPDSLIEAVQTELSRLGYYTGRIDAVYRPDTKEAIRRFQNDQGLKATGRINEATLHALQLD